jgi:asparagine synthase (glutamine-hydrolysing)
MCGIAGIVALADNAAPPGREALLRMAHALDHRGPDELGLYVDDHAGLAHTRLSIIDLATGQQPLSNEAGTLWVTFNGEIFNHIELRATLSELGHHFRTHSDTEVVVHAYDEWGDAAFSRFNGQWALALWDNRKRRLVLSRDRLGVRPLYVCLHAGSLYFASEVKAIFAAERGIQRAFDPVGLEQTFTFWSVLPPQSVFVGVEELPPASVRTYSAGHVSDHIYWSPEYPQLAQPETHYPGTIEDATRDVLQALEHAVSLRMLRADVPVGSYLSGGLDSSLVAALGRRFAEQAFCTFSLRFADAEYDETPYQRMMVEHIDSQHRELVVSREDIARVFPEVVRHAERPLLRTAPAPLYLLSKLVREAGIKVVLTGEGADEIFAGYDLFREGKVRRFWAKQPASRLRPLLLHKLYPYLARSPVAQQAMARQFFGQRLSAHAEPGFAHHTRWDTTSALKRMLSPEIRAGAAGRDVVRELFATLPCEFPRWSPLAQDQHLEIRTLLSGYLLSSQGDRMLMAHSVEGRFPFLDREVVALGSALPSSYKLRGLDEKHVLKRAARGLVPDAIIARSKQPYRAPDALSFLGPGASYVADLLTPSALRRAGVFETQAVSQLWRKCQARAPQGQFSNTDNMALVSVISTQLLHEELIQQTPRAHHQARLLTDVDQSSQGESRATR